MTAPVPWSPAVRAAMQPARGPWCELRMVIPTRRLSALLQLADMLQAGAYNAPAELGEAARAEAMHVAALLRQVWEQHAIAHGPAPDEGQGG